MSRGMVAFLAGMGGGYLKGREQARRQEMEDEDRAAAKENRDFIKAERDRVTATRNRLADAAAPVTMQSVLEKPDYADNRDVGQPGVELIDTGARRVGQQTFAPGQMEQAAAALAEANKPGAAAARQADVLAASGDPVGAQSLRAGLRQEKLGDLQLDEAQRTALNRQFEESLGPLSSHEAIADTVSNSGIGGAGKLRAVPSADGKKVGYVMIGADGKETPTAYSFDNTPQGMLEAKLAVSKLTPTSQKLDYLFKKWSDERATAKEARDAENDKARLDLERRKVDILGMRAATAAGGASEAAPIWDKSADEFLKSRYTVKDPETQAVTVDGAGLQFAKTIALGVSRSNGGDTTLALGKAFEVDTKLRAAAKNDPQKLAELRQQYLAAVAGGRPAPAADAPAPAPAPAAIPPQRMVAPPPAPAAPGVIDKATGAVSRAFTGMQSVGAQYQAIDARAREAGAGGAPLTPQEAAIAKQFGIAF